MTTAMRIPNPDTPCLPAGGHWAYANRAGLPHLFGNGGGLAGSPSRTWPRRSLAVGLLLTDRQGHFNGVGLCAKSC